MGRKKYKLEQIIGKLLEAEVLLSQGFTACEVGRKLGISGRTYYRWRKQYGGMMVDQARGLIGLVADLSLDSAIRRETIRGIF